MAEFSDIRLDFLHDGKVGVITLNRPSSYNALRQQTYQELVNALRQLENDPEVFITVITGEGPNFFSSGADFNEVVSGANDDPLSTDDARRKTRSMLDVGPTECARLLINHSKVTLVALNGPVVGWPAGWIGNADVILASDKATLHALFSQLGLCPEGGSSDGFVRRMGVGPAAEALIFARKFTAQELFQIGFVNRVFPHETFRDEVQKYISTVLESNVGASMLAAKKLIRDPLRPAAVMAANEELTTLTERFVSGDPIMAFMKMAQRASERRKAKL